MSSVEFCRSDGHHSENKSKTINKYLHFVRELKLWNIRVTVIQIVAGELEIFPKGLEM